MGIIDLEAREKFITVLGIHHCRERSVMGCDERGAKGDRVKSATLCSNSASTEILFSLIGTKVSRKLISRCRATMRSNQTMFMALPAFDLDRSKGGDGSKAHGGLRWRRKRKAWM